MKWTLLESRTSLNLQYESCQWKALLQDFEEKRMDIEEHTWEPPNYSPPPDSDHTTVSVPVHANKDLGTGMQRSLMKKTGIVESDL